MAERFLNQYLIITIIFMFFAVFRIFGVIFVYDINQHQ